MKGTKLETPMLFGLSSTFKIERVHITQDLKALRHVAYCLARRMDSFGPYGKNPFPLGYALMAFFTHSPDVNEFTPAVERMVAFHLEYTESAYDLLCAMSERHNEEDESDV
jgi:hypothetical protein